MSGLFSRYFLNAWPGFLTRYRRETPEMPVDARRAKGGRRRHTRRYVEETELAQRSGHGHIRRCSRWLVRNAG